MDHTEGHSAPRAALQPTTVIKKSFFEGHRDGAGMYFLLENGGLRPPCVDVDRENKRDQNVIEFILKDLKG